MGLFVIAGAALFIVGIYLIGNKQTLFGSSFELTSTFRNVNGLQIGNNVRYSGINVGTVGEIEMISDTAIKVTMRIDENTQQFIKPDAVATISSDGLVGSMFVNIIPGNGTAGIVSSGDEITSYSKIGADDMLSTLNVTNENAALLTADLLKITGSITKGEGTIGLLLTDSAMAMDLKATVANLKSTSQKTTALLDKLNHEIEGFTNENSIAGVLFKDTVQAQTLRDIITNLSSVSAGVISTIDSLNMLMSDIRSGPGTMTTLLYDSAVANDLKAAMKNINSGTVLLNEDLEALQHSFPLKGYYKKEAKRKAREEKKASKN